MIIEFGFTGFSYKKGTMFGRANNYPIYSLRLGIVAVQYLPEDTRTIFRNALDGLTEDKQWLVKNQPEIVKYKDSLENSIRVKIKAEYLTKLRNLKRENERYYAENTKLRTQNHTIKKTISYLREDDEN